MAAENGPVETRTRVRVAEYLLIVVLIVLVAVGTLVLFSTQLGEILAWIAQEIHTE